MERHNECPLRLAAQEAGGFEGWLHPSLTADGSDVVQALRLQPRGGAYP